MNNAIKRRFAAILSGAMLCSVMMASAGASNYDGNTYKRDLDKNYVVDDSKEGMHVVMKYGVKKTWSMTSIQLGAGPATGKAYTGLMERSFFGGDDDFVSNSSTKKLSNGYIDVTVDGDTNYANYVLHSGTSDVTYEWRFDRKYENS